MDNQQEQVLDSSREQKHHMVAFAIAPNTPKDRCLMVPTSTFFVHDIGHILPSGPELVFAPESFDIV